MALNKQPININFQQGLDTKTDPYQVPIGKFLTLQNSIFLKGGLLQKRNGYGALPALPDETSSLVTTFNGNLTAIGDDLKALAQGPMQWFTKGNLKPIELNTLPLIRNSTTQDQADAVVASNGLICTAYTDQNPANLTIPIYKYAVADSVTGQNVIEPTVLTTANPTFGTPRVFILGFYFIIVFTAGTSGDYNLSYIAISINNPVIITPAAILATNYTPATTLSWDAVVYNNALYVAWPNSSNSEINMNYLTSHFSIAGTVIRDTTHGSTIMSLAADIVNGVIWASYFNATNAYSFAVDQNLNPILVPTLIITSTPVLNLASVANAGILTFIYEVSNSYTYDPTIPTNYSLTNTLTQGGVGGGFAIVLRSVGLASKAFMLNGTIYALFTYQSPYQSTYFLSDISGNIVAELAYGNGRGYLPFGLPSVSVTGNEAQIAYLYKDQITAVNKNTNVPAGSQVDGIFSQLGINLVSFTFETSTVVSAEIGANLNITGGFLWGYDGYLPVEQGFFLWPDSVEVSTLTTGGSLAAQTYFYQVTYEWTDNSGNAFRSAPSIPVSIVTTGATSSNTINVPTLRLTYKIANPLKIVIYRWSTSQEIYYQVTSILLPVLNDTSINSVAFVDISSDATILGNNILYTTGGVLENTGGPSFNSVFLFDDRLWGIDAEDPNLLWYSKQVIQATPVELSELLTYYVAPTLGAQGSTGPLMCGSPMDSNLILFKSSAMVYISGTGPDNTGANSQYSQPIFITSTIGCSNQKSIVLQPQGLMFEFASDAGNQIWLLGRDLSTQYIGAPVEAYTTDTTVQSAVNIPGTNQVRFTLNSGITLMFDYYYQQWGTFVDVPAISSCLYQGLHTYINSLGQVFQETPGLYLDNAQPVLMSFATSWINLGGLQGYQRAYEFSLLGTYYTPHFINLFVGYDYNPNPSSFTTISPSNFSPFYGEDLDYGSGNPYGGSQALEQWRIRMKQQRCESFQVILKEVYDPSFGVVSGRGLTLSGINLVIGVKKGFRPYKAADSVGLS